MRRGRGLVRLASGSYIIPSAEMPSESESADPEYMEKLQLHAARTDGQAFLAYSERSTGQLREKMLSLGYPLRVAELTVKWAIEYGFVDDTRYCALFARSKKMGKARLRLELIKRGAEESAVEEYISRLSDEEHFSNAVKLVAARYGRIEDREKALRRASGWLSRRGYSGEFIHRVLKEAL